MDILPTFRPRSGPFLRATLWGVAHIVLASLLLLASQKGALNGLQDAAIWAMGPLAAPLRDLGDWGSDVARGLFRRPQVIRENEALRQEVEQLRAQLAAQADAGGRVRELESMMGLRAQRGQDELLVAHVIALHLDASTQAIAIDRGQEDGLVKGMAVLSAQGSLVGTISHLLPHHAWVTLVTDPRMRVNVAVQTTPGEEVWGMWLGQVGGGPTVDMLPQGAPIKAGQLVVTSGLGGQLPPGILVGTIKSVDDNPQHIFVRAAVEPAARLDRLRTVAVLTSHRPAELGEP